MEFEDLMNVDDVRIQQMLRKSGMETLAVALKAASPMVKNKITANMSVRACDELEKILGSLGAVEMTRVMDAQDQLLAAV